MAENYELLETLTDAILDGNSVAYNNDGTELAVGSEDNNNVYIYDTNTGPDPDPGTGKTYFSIFQDCNSRSPQNNTNNHL